MVHACSKCYDPGSPLTLTRWSGAPLLEGGMKKSRPGYAAYKARTSAFFPLPPKKSAG